MESKVVWDLVYPEKSAIVCVIFSWVFLVDLVDFSDKNICKTDIRNTLSNFSSDFSLKFQKYLQF